MLLVVTVLDSADLAAWSNSILFCHQHYFIGGDAKMNSYKPVLFNMTAMIHMSLLNTWNGPSPN